MLAIPIIFFWVEQQDKDMDYEHGNFKELFFAREQFA